MNDSDRQPRHICPHVRSSGRTARSTASLPTSCRTPIADGSFPVGASLPKEAEIADRFGISLITVRQALRELAADGLIRKRSAKPAVVAAPGAARCVSVGTSAASATWPPMPGRQARHQKLPPRNLPPPAHLRPRRARDGATAFTPSSSYATAPTPRSRRTSRPPSAEAFKRTISTTSSFSAPCRSISASACGRADHGQGGGRRRDARARPRLRGGRAGPDAWKCFTGRSTSSRSNSRSHDTGPTSTRSPTTRQTTSLSSPTAH